MSSETLRLPKGAIHHPILISHFDLTESAQLAVTSLMAEGLSEQDLTLLMLSDVAGKSHTDSLEHLVAPFSGGPADDADTSATAESEIGGGISTTTPEDDVSAIEEMDDSETAADDVMYPSDDHSIGDEEVRDVEHAADKGFFDTTNPGLRHRRIAEPLFEEIALPGLGILIGEGSFGSTLLDRVFKQNDTSLAWLAARLNGRDREAVITIGNGGALLAIDVNAQGPNPDRIEEVLTGQGADWVRTL